LLPDQDGYMKYLTIQYGHRPACTLAVVALLVLGGCASIPADHGRNNVNALLAERGTSADVTTTGLLDALIATPLTPDSAVRVALINNPRLQSTYASLGLGAADVYAAGRIRNPVFSASILGSSRDSERDQVTFGLATSFTDIITLPARERLAQDSFAALQQAVGAEVLAVAGQTEKAYYDYACAQQVARLRTRIATTGALSAALAGRYRDAGNLSPRELALERDAASQSRLAALAAQTAAYSARTQLADLLGLSVGGGWTVPATLPLPVAQEDDLDTLLSLANDARLDLAAARATAQVRADQLGVVNWSRWLGELDVGLEHEQQSGGGSLAGPSLAWELPIFNQHQDAVVRADVELQIALNDVRRIATEVDNDVHLAHANVDSARARAAEYREVMLPLRLETVAHAQREVNYMLLGAFELIRLKEAEYDAYQGYAEALRDYWVARADLGLATGTRLPSNAHIGQQHLDIEQWLQPPAGGMDHSGHDMTTDMTTDITHDGTTVPEQKPTHHEHDANSGGAQ
jgi:cobalt-zinc-cadmium efflux system outer membrane protein